MQSFFLYLETDSQLIWNFHYAARHGDIATVDQMLKNGMPVDVRSLDGWTALHEATSHNRTDVVRRLVHERADVNRQERCNKDTPLHWAALHNYTELARLLIDNGADINLKNDVNKTPLDVASEGSGIKSKLRQLQQSAL